MFQFLVIPSSRKRDRQVITAFVIGIFPPTTSMITYVSGKNDDAIISFHEPSAFLKISGHRTAIKQTGLSDSHYLLEDTRVRRI